MILRAERISLRLAVAITALMTGMTLAAFRLSHLGIGISFAPQSVRAWWAGRAPSIAEAADRLAVPASSRHAYVLPTCKACRDAEADLRRGLLLVPGLREVAVHVAELPGPIDPWACGPTRYKARVSVLVAAGIEAPISEDDIRKFVRARLSRVREISVEITR